MNAAYPEIQELGASMVAISPQTVHQSFLMADQHHLQFPLLSDAGNKVARQFGLVYRVPEEQEEIYRRSFVNLPSINGDSSWELPIPATYVIGNRTADRHALSAVEGSVCPTANHLILYASANPDYTKRPEPAEIIHTLAQLLS